VVARDGKRPTNAARAKNAQGVTVNVMAVHD
jgi:hypothetical protein